MPRPAVLGMSLRELQFPAGVSCAIAHVRRGDVDLLPSPEIVLEPGDRWRADRPLRGREHACAQASPYNIWPFAALPSRWLSPLTRQAGVYCNLKSAPF
jgi:hypothetical protein